MTVNIEGVGKITANAEVLSEVAAMAANSRDYYRERGLMTLANRNNRIFDSIYECLDNNGYYIKINADI